jgi:hypothetical protein
MCYKDYSTLAKFSWPAMKEQAQAARKGAGQ